MPELGVVKITDNEKSLKKKYLAVEQELRRLELEQQDFIEAVREVFVSMANLLKKEGVSQNSYQVLNSLANLISDGPVSRDFSNTAAGNMKSLLKNLRVNGNGLEVLPNSNSSVDISTQGSDSFGTSSDLFSKKSSDDILIRFLNRFMKDFSTTRDNKYHEEVLSIIDLIKSGQGSQVVLSMIIHLWNHFKDDVFQERNVLSAKLSDIVRCLVVTEKEYCAFLDQSSHYLGTTNQDFNQNLNQQIDHIQDAVSEACIEENKDPDKLVSLISAKLLDLREIIRKKTELDQLRMKSLSREKEAVESRLDIVRRDYHMFSQKSHDLLKELDDLKSISQKDALTKVYNRRAYNEQITRTLESYREQIIFTFSFLIFDIDMFRDFNNNYGHQAGDSILIHVARLVTEVLRSDDFVFRYGGDEFIILLLGATIKDAMSVAEKIRKKIANVDFKLSRQSEKTVKVTISMGVTEVESHDDTLSILARADKALYVSKHGGRNQVSAG